MAVKASQRSEGRLKVVTLCNTLTGYTLRLLSNETLFPKRSRWLIAGKIADIMNDFHTAVNTANELTSATQQEAEHKYEIKTLALAYLYAAEAKMEMAADVFEIDVDRLEYWAGLMNEEIGLLNTWINQKGTPV